MRNFSITSEAGGFCKLVDAERGVTIKAKREGVNAWDIYQVSIAPTRERPELGVPLLASGGPEIGMGDAIYRGDTVVGRCNYVPYTEALEGFYKTSARERARLRQAAHDKVLAAQDRLAEAKAEVEQAERERDALS